MDALLDTSVLAARRVPALDWSSVVSIITIGELKAGVHTARDTAIRAERLRRLTTIVELAPILRVDRAVADCYGELRAASGRQASNDLWIAATAYAHDLTLITADRQLAALPLVRAELVGVDA